MSYLDSESFFQMAYLMFLTSVSQNSFSFYAWLLVRKAPEFCFSAGNPNLLLLQYSSPHLKEINWKVESYCLKEMVIVRVFQIHIKSQPNCMVKCQCLLTDNGVYVTSHGVRENWAMFQLISQARKHRKRANILYKKLMDWHKTHL